MNESFFISEHSFLTNVRANIPRGKVYVTRAVVITLLAKKNPPQYSVVKR